MWCVGVSQLVILIELTLKTHSISTYLARVLSSNQRSLNAHNNKENDNLIDDDERAGSELVSEQDFSGRLTSLSRSIKALHIFAVGFLCVAPLAYFTGAFLVDKTIDESQDPQSRFS